MKQFTIYAEFDPKAKVWCGSNAELPLTTEAAPLDELLARAAVIAPEIAIANGLTKNGEQVTVRVTVDRIVTITNVKLRDLFAELRRRYPLPPGTVTGANKRFFDLVSADKSYPQFQRDDRMKRRKSSRR